MARTIVGVNDAKAVKRYAGLLAYDESQKSYFGQRFVGRGAEAEVPIQLLSELESDAGEQIAYDLLAELKMAPVEGDDILEGKEEAQRFYTDTIYIDQARCGVNTGGRMTRKRTLHNLREKARRQQSSWWARLKDELRFIYLSGARGVNTNFILPTGYTGRANNALVAPDTNHILYGGNSTAKSNMTNEAAGAAGSDTFDLRLVDRAKTKADSQGGGATDIPVLQPCKIDGEEVFVCVMHTFQEDDLRSNTGTGQWLDIQKAIATSEGRKSPMVKGSLGMYRGCILHSHRNVIRFNDYGAGGTYEAARALFMGSQALVEAYGSPGTGLRFDWHEEVRDNGNQVVISSNCTWGTKKVSFTTPIGAQDFGVFAMDTYAASR
ncbi:MAG TPA: N4-gp56 family major capsid protein [Rhodocyclaceae bacterium]|uniref:N4-gp56 family major capsid protein n=1 Tax=Accumulibacter sp. TaxID=2053492 RepID=UPI002C8F973D|nr:N4-gp56 family major capsid protein [Accumulibacter sp.]HNI00618.1 N4-gp56 family major capsid protein [Rhodocyclaceae bacterium]HNL98562.1 N4-gp56 family major capsid protein [Accumulibacter sp.]